MQVGDDVAEKSGSVDLATAIGALRRQLRDAQVAGQEEDLSFDVGTVEVEFTVEARTTGHVEGGLQFWLLTAKAKHQRTSTARHVVRLQLTPTGSLSISSGGKAPPGE